MSLAQAYLDHLRKLDVKSYNGKTANSLALSEAPDLNGWRIEHVYERVDYASSVLQGRDAEAPYGESIETEPLSWLDRDMSWAQRRDALLARQVSDVVMSPQPHEQGWSSQFGEV